MFVSFWFFFSCKKIVLLEHKKRHITSDICRYIYGHTFLAGNISKWVYVNVQKVVQTTCVEWSLRKLTLTKHYIVLELYQT